MAENETKERQDTAPVPAEVSQRITELEKKLAGRTDELTQAGDRLAELESAAKEAAAALCEANSRADNLAGSLKTIFAGYKTLIVQANPDVPVELLSGETVEALEGSLARARELIGRVKKNLEATNSADRVPAGAPQRGNPDTAGLSSREKIKLGVEKSRYSR